MAELWFVKRADGTIAGPLLERDVAADLMSHEIDDTQFVRQGQSGPWCEAARARALFEQLAAVGWYVRINGEEFGPFTDTRLLQLHRDGELNQTSEVRQGSKGNWKPAESVLSIFQNQKAQRQATTNDESVLPSESDESVSGSKWSVEPIRHAVVDLEIPYSSAAGNCERLEHLMLHTTTDPQMEDRLLVARTNGERIGFLGLENSRQILANSDRGLSHIALLHSVPSATPISVAIILVPPGYAENDCHRYIDEHFRSLV